MRKTTFAFLTLLAVLPSLMCFMAFCPMQSAQASEPCHEMSSDDEGGGVMLVSDCMGVEFFAQDVSYDLQSDQVIQGANFIWTDLTVSYNFEPENINGIRGPPFGDPPHFNASTLYLTTQRLRI